MSHSTPGPTRTVFLATILLGFAMPGFGQILPMPAVEPFPLGDVKLLPGPFQEARDRTFSNLRTLVDADRMLYAFRKTAALDTKGAAPLNGWEDPTCPVRGSYPGHVLSALSQGVASTGDPDLARKLDYLVTELARVQDASRAAGYSDGYLSAFPERLVDSLINQHWGWAPLYAIHKVFAGMLDAHRLTGNPKALDVAKKLGLWYYEKFRPFTQAQRDALWNVPVAGEYGGSGESLASLYALTGDTRYLVAARYFDKEALFGPLRSNVDALAGLHANTHIPQVIGALRIYEASGETPYWNVAWNFFRIVTRAHLYPNGGMGWKEDFFPPYQVYEHLDSDKSDWPATAETCCAYNLLKLARGLFLLRPDPSIFDYYEHALYNQILASQDPADPYGHATYYQPMRPGSIKIYGTSATKPYTTTEQDNTPYKCCCGTGLENATKFNESIYFHAGDTLYVNLFIPSTLDWKAKGIGVTLQTRYPASDTVRLVLRGTSRLVLKIRNPGWLRQSSHVRIDGIPLGTTPAIGSYFAIERPWKDGSVVEVVLPQSLRYAADPDSTAVGSVFWGNLLLTGQLGANMVRTTPTLDARSILPTANPLEFAANSGLGPVTLRPFYLTHHQRYTPYWRLANAPADQGEEAPSMLEAERAEIRHANRIYGNPQAHASGHVGGIDFDDSRVLFRLHRTSTARCTVVVYYANGSPANSTHRISTGFWDTTLSYRPTGGWGMFDSTRLAVPLSTGENALVFAKGEGFAELDAIRTIDPIQGLFPLTLEAEDGVVEHAKVYTVKGFSNGALVGGMDFPDSRIVFPPFSVPSAGRWVVRLLYSNGSASPARQSLQSTLDSCQANYRPTGSWDARDSVEVALALPKGTSRLELAFRSGFAQVDALRVLGPAENTSLAPSQPDRSRARLVRRGTEFRLVADAAMAGARLEIASLDGRSRLVKTLELSDEGATAHWKSDGHVGQILTWRLLVQGQVAQTGIQTISP